MQTKENVLQLLVQAKGSYLKGQDIASQLGLSRNAVWKAIQQLKEEGNQIESDPKKGYQITTTGKQVSQGAIKAYLEDAGLDQWQVQVFPTIDSTNLYAKTMDWNPEDGPHLIVSDQQTLGRGRLGRTFFSPPGTGIYFSLLFAPFTQGQDLSLVTAAASVALARAMQTFSGKTVQIKWVNDIFLGSKKISGILTEAVTSLETQTMERMILGIGVNLLPNPDLDPELIDIVGSLFDDPGQALDRNAFLALFMQEWSRITDHWQDRSWLAEYASRSNVLGKQVKVIQGQESYLAYARSIDQWGHLEVETTDGQVQTLHYGEVSIRPQNDSRR